MQDITPQPIVDKILSSDDHVSSLVLRVPVGLILAGHGAQKLFGWFGGYGLQGTGQWMASVGIEPGYTMALLAGSAEFFGGIALVIGLLTRPAALVTAFTMLVAMLVVHWPNGFFLTTNGIEYSLTLLAATCALLFQGGGALSLDNVISRSRRNESVCSLSASSTGWNG